MNKPTNILLHYIVDNYKETDYDNHYLVFSNVDLLNADSVDGISNVYILTEADLVLRRLVDQNVHTCTVRYWTDLYSEFFASK